MSCPATCCGGEPDRRRSPFYRATLAKAATLGSALLQGGPRLTGNLQILAAVPTRIAGKGVAGSAVSVGVSLAIATQIVAPAGRGYVPGDDADQALIGSSVDVDRALMDQALISPRSSA